MRNRHLQALLRRTHESPKPDPECAARLEQQVLSQYSALHGRRRRLPGVLLRSSLARTAGAAVLGIALLGMACEIPTQSQVELGQHVHATFVSGPVLQDEARFDASLRAALESAGVDKLRLSLSHTDTGMTALDLVAWGADVSPAALEDVLRQQLGDEALSSIDVDALTGTVSESLGRRVGRRMFGLDVEQETAEELRAAILEQLAAQGLDDASVQVEDDGARRTITVEAASPDGSRQVANEIILEVKDK